MYLTKSFLKSFIIIISNKLFKNCLKYSADEEFYIINIQYGTCEDLIARHKLYTCLRTLARRYNTIALGWAGWF